MNKILPMIVIALLFTGCGKKGPLVPPEALAPEPITDLRVKQVGNGFTVCLTPPSKDETGKPLSTVSDVRVMKREVLPPAEDCEQCPTAYNLFRIIDFAYPSNVVRLDGLYCLFDHELDTGRTYQYKAVSFETDGTVSRDSNKVRRTFNPAPSAPKVTAVSSPTGVALEWTPAPKPESGDLIGYNIYRSRSRVRMPPAPVNRQPVSESKYQDESVELGTKYFYAVRTVSMVAGEMVESQSSNVVEGERKMPEE